ncbi:uncharacterized protein LAESUDRAFT_676046 [Laetiporus sulphureus 93-53]|uniref:DUF6534 domain-containing protein n=1 Tax=Laetiporus sulphureus 93-53 TaxID=1314785 RepID=A0A165FAY9_9APHY|nr:uncharacterized protein LAESUDRAFT_676046 [Laetiporus sulphureus 93-53]KZT08691.1 hypothetical protein LAESUDRAFT_676046 [Laetiporus sulphureus 93-53]
MATEIRFNSYGIPHIVEFGNVKFRARSSSRSRSCTSTLDDDHPTSTYERSVSSLGTVATASSETLAQPDDDGAGTAGLFIQFAASTRPYRKMSEGRVRRLKRRIAKAVMAAGMDSSPTSEKANPIEVARLSRLSCGSIESTDSVPEDDGAALFRGTYGQVTTALQAAGLITIPCRDVGVDSGDDFDGVVELNFVFVSCSSARSRPARRSGYTEPKFEHGVCTPYSHFTRPDVHVLQSGGCASRSRVLTDPYQRSHCQSYAATPMLETLVITDPSMATQLNETMGPAFIGVVFALAYYPNDKLFLKLLFLWYWLVTNHAKLDGLGSLPGTFTAEFFLASLTVFVVQCHFIMTIWKLLTDRWFQMPLTSVMVLLAAVSFGGGIVTVYRVTIDTTTTAAVIHATIPASMQTVTAFVTDIYITASLCWILRGRKTGYKRTETLITTLTIYAIHRGVFTGIIQLAHFATYISTIHSRTLYWMLWHIPGSKIYVNSLLAVLNVRHSLLRDAVEEETHNSVEAFPLGTVTTLGRPFHSRAAARPNTSQTQIMLTKEVVRDDGVTITHDRPRGNEDFGQKHSPW